MLAFQHYAIPYGSVGDYMMPITVIRKKAQNSPSKDRAGQTEGIQLATAKEQTGHTASSPKKTEGAPSGSQASAGQSRMHDLTEEESQFRARLRSKLNLITHLAQPA
jgi:hypothetical protein